MDPVPAPIARLLPDERAARRCGGDPPPLRSGQRANGLLLAAIAITNALLDLGNTTTVLLFVSNLLESPAAVLFAHLLLRWPHDRITARSHRALLAIGYVVPTVMTLAWELFWRNDFFDGPARARFWITLRADETLSIGLYRTQSAVAGVLVLAFLVAILLRFREVRGRERRALARSRSRSRPCCSGSPTCSGS